PTLLPVRTRCGLLNVLVDVLAIASLQAHQIALLRLAKLLQVAQPHHATVPYPHHALQPEALPSSPPRAESGDDGVCCPGCSHSVPTPLALGLRSRSRSGRRKPSPAAD